MRIANFLLYFTVFLTILGSCKKDDDGPAPEPELEKFSLPTPSLSLPEDDKICENGTSVSETESKVTFTWNLVADAESYDLSVKDLEGGQIRKVTGVKGIRAEMTLKKGIPYSWNITARSAKAEKPVTGEDWQFYLAAAGTANYAPFPAEHMAPDNGKTVTSKDGEVELKWSGSDTDGDTLTYTLYLDTLDGKRPPAETLKNLETDHISVKVQTGTTYFWRVKTSDGTNSSFSQVASFTVE